MCTNVVELGFLVFGIWLLVAGKLPNKVLSVLFGRGEYEIPPVKARLMGLLLASPWPVYLIIYLFMRYSFGAVDLIICMSIEVVYMILVGVLSGVIARKYRRKPEITSAVAIELPIEQKLP